MDVLVQAMTHGGIPLEGWRRVVPVPGRVWAHQPDDCPRSDVAGEWVLDRSVLVCPDCGLNCT